MEPPPLVLLVGLMLLAVAGGRRDGPGTGEAPECRWKGRREEERSGPRWAERKGGGGGGGVGGFSRPSAGPEGAAEPPQPAVWPRSRVRCARRPAGRTWALFAAAFCLLSLPRRVHLPARPFPTARALRFLSFRLSFFHRFNFQRGGGEDCERRFHAVPGEWSVPPGPHGCGQRYGRARYARHGVSAAVPALVLAGTARE